MTVRINKQKINLREKLTEFEDRVNFDEVVRGLGENTAPLILNKDGGNVGIGTAGPQNLLHVEGSGANKAIAYLKNTDSADGNGLIIRAGGSNSQKYIADFGNAAETSVMKIMANGDVSINGTVEYSSDDRVKHNEQAIVGAIETLGKLAPKKYIKTTEMYEANHDFELDADGNPVDENGEPVEHNIEAGVIAQQVLGVPELAFIVSPEGVDEDGNVTRPHGLNYNSLFTYAIAAIQEQQSIIEDLKSRIETLESK